MAVYDGVIEIEDILIESLGDEAELDGHDIGSGEMNIFIWTSDPRAAFAVAQAALAANRLWEDVRAGFREEAEDTYTALWPEDLSDFAIS